MNATLMITEIRVSHPLVCPTVAIASTAAGATKRTQMSSNEICMRLFTFTFT